ncbi:MAG TPA: hypothetical protein VMV94_19970 [Phycisphaerae bacterium]|nr:hypothetical protein [Phycisphaerae bacterium]
MTTWRNMLLAFALCAALVVQTAGAQQSSSDGLGKRAEQAKSGTIVPGITRTRGTNISTFYSAELRKSQTRLERLRTISPLATQRMGLLPDPTVPLTPIQRILDQRNFLRARSSLGRAETAFLGRSLPLAGEGVVPQSPGVLTAAATTTTSPAGEAPAPLRLEETLQERINKTADDNFELGMSYCREGDLLRARYHFDLAKHLWLDKSRPRLACMAVAFESEDYFQATAELLQALRLAKTLDDLRIEGFADQFYPGNDPAEKRRALARTIDAVNRFVVATDNNPLAKLLLAYYSWLNGDVGVAASTADAVSQAIPEPGAGYVRKFRDMLTEEQRPADTAVKTESAAAVVATQPAAR